MVSEGSVEGIVVVVDQRSSRRKVPSSSPEPFTPSPNLGLDLLVRFVLKTRC